MGKKEKKLEQEELNEKEEKTEEAVNTEETAETAPEKEENPLEAEIARLKEELAKVNDINLRLRAEYDNYRRRTEKEKAQIYSDGLSEAVEAILPVADNLDRALEQKDADAGDMYKGVEMIKKQFTAAMKKLGVDEMAGEGEEFNPELHNAVAHIESEEYGENVISAVYQKGYLLKDKVIRHAMVQVAN